MFLPFGRRFDRGEKMDFQKIYNDFIADRKAKEPEIYRGLTFKQRKSKPSTINDVSYEQHHIKPRYLGIDDSAENIVALTGADHFLIHYYFAEVVNTKPAWAAVMRMANGSNKNKNTRTTIRNDVPGFAEKYAKACEKNKEFMAGEKNPMHRKSVKKKISKAHKKHKANGTGMYSKKARENLKKSHNTLEYKAKISALVSGENNAMYGKHGGKNPNACKVKCIETGEIFESVKDAKIKYPGDLTKALRTGGTSGGYHWKRLGDNKLAGKKALREYKNPHNTIYITYKNETLPFRTMCEKCRISPTKINGIMKEQNLSYQGAFDFHRQITEDFTLARKPNRNRPVKNLDTNVIYNSLKDATAATGGKNPSLIGNAIKRQKTSGGYRWAYA